MVVHDKSVIQHNGISTTEKIILSFGLKWNKMRDHIFNFVKSCKQCINQAPEKPCNTPKVIEPTWPMNRIVADNWTIPKKFLQFLQPDRNYKYVLTCVDHFSKYKWCFLIPNKEPSTILERLEIVFSTFTKPNIFQSDNGTEFKNSDVKKFCENKNIKIINGGVRHPQSQGVVEKINDFVAKSLKASFEDFLKKLKESEKTEIESEIKKKKKVNKKGNNNKEKKFTGQRWGIETALMMFVSNQNSKPHTVTNLPPVELINYRNLNNSDHLKIIEKVKERIYSYYLPKPPKEKEGSRKKKKVDKKRLPNLKLDMKVFMIGDVKKISKINQLFQLLQLKKLKLKPN